MSAALTLANGVEEAFWREIMNGCNELIMAANKRGISSALAKTLQSLKSSLSAKLPAPAWGTRLTDVMAVDVALVSGQCAEISASKDMTVLEVRRRAEEFLGLRIKHLVTSTGRVLCFLSTLGEEAVADGDCLTAISRQGTLVSSVGGAAFALLKADGSVVAWGDASSGGHLSRSQEEQLNDVEQICPSFGAFAAVAGNGHVITWGDYDFGADSQPVKHQLKDVKEVFATGFAFENYPGGDSRAVQDQLHDVKTIASSSLAFAAIRNDGSVVTWGSKNPCVDPEELQDVTHIAGSHEAFCALRADGSCFTWGGAKFGGDSQKVQERLVGVRRVVGSNKAFCALRDDGQCVCWGDETCGGLVPPHVEAELQGIRQIFASHGAFAAVRCDGKCITWGGEDYGGDSSAVQEKLANVQFVTPSKRAFCAVLMDGSVVSWGDRMRVAEMGDVQDQLYDVQHLVASSNAFCAMRRDGRCVTWGDWRFGGDSSKVSQHLQNAMKRIKPRIKRSFSDTTLAIDR
eukprot:symbB.v1.2.004425.t1/scaffold248.1/size253060/1